MPAFLLPIIEKLLLWGAPALIRAGLVALEKKYPGMRSIIESLISFIEAAPSQTAATQVAKEQIDQLKFPAGNDIKT